MKRMKWETRHARKVRQNLLKAGVWLFLALFIFSIVGIAIVIAK
jgi:hypothetical protein